MARNLTVSGIDHPYWNSRKGNSVRFAIWAKRRSFAATYLREIASHHDEAVKTRLLAAADAFEREVPQLDAIVQVLPVSAPEEVHCDKGNIIEVRTRLAAAEAEHTKGVEALELALGAFDVGAKDADGLERRVIEGNGTVAESALAALMKLAPADLDARLARLWTACPDAKKEGADGPIHRQILFALDTLKTDLATEAIGRAVFFEGKGDDVSPAVSRWAAEMYWARRGKAGRAVWEKAIDSTVEHVRVIAAKYVGRLGDAALLPKVAAIANANAYYARILLGDEGGWDALAKELGGERPTQAYLLLVELGAPSEAHVLPLLGDANPAVMAGAAVTLSRVGTEASLDALSKCAKAHPEVPRLGKALDDLKRRLAK